MLTVHQVSKSFGIETVLQEVSFRLSPGERLGLVGPNGSGKTTLLRILAGREQPDSGVVQLNPPVLQVGYLPQGLEIPPDEPIGSYLARVEGDIPGLAARLEQLALGLANFKNQPERLQRYTRLEAEQIYAVLEREYDEVLARLEAASQGAGRGPEILAGLGLGRLPLDTPAGSLSGGQKTRLGLAGVLLAAPRLLLLDEPTNHLDLEMLAWLEDWLTGATSSGMGALIVSHDRAFLDRTVTGILEIDPETHSLRAYAGNYSQYLEQKLAERDRQWQAYSDQQEEIDRLRGAAAHVRSIARFKRGGKGDSGDKFAKGFFGNRTLETIRRAKALEKRLERLLTEERLEKPRQSWQMKLDFGETPPSGRDVLRLEDLSVGYGENALLSGLNLDVRLGARVALVGPNGAGKTTLLRTIAGHLPPLAGQVRLGANVHLGYMAQEQEDLDPGLDALATIQRLAPLSETEARAFLHQFLFSGDDVFLPASRLSFGERARLSLACLVAQGCNLLLLDEPINHLDIPSRARFEQALSGFGGTVLVVVHDRFFLAGYATQVWEVAEQGLRRWEP